MTATQIRDLSRPGNAAPTRTVVAPSPASWRIEPLLELPMLRSPIVRGGPLPPDLAARFGAELAIPLRVDGPTVVANFVSTLDGAVALDPDGASGGREISGGFEPDRFLMGLLRATADAVLVGAGTVRASQGRSWVPGHAHPPSAPAFAAWRAALGLAAAPTAVIVTASGDLGSGRTPVRAGQPVVVATTEVGAHRLRKQAGTDVDIEVLADRGPLPVDALLGLLQRRGFGLVLSEAGPTLFGQLLAAGAVDELFLTLAPQLVGRDESTTRLALVEETAFVPRGAPWARLRAVLRSADHLFLRYDLRRRADDGETDHD